jgi:carbonic anhydrase
MQPRDPALLTLARGLPGPLPHTDTMSTSLQELFDNNRDWAAATEARQPGFFSRLLQQQAPQYLWIGCADSRVPANELVGLLPGELFVHRNVANVVVHSDLNCLSVIQFAVEMLKVQHIIVVGHSNCGGVAAALQDLRVGLADNWIRHVQDVRNRHLEWLEQLPAARRLPALVELNVLEQALNVCQTTVVQDAWQRGQEVVVHGWVYGLHNGLLRDLTMTVTGPDTVAPAFELALDSLKRRHDRATEYPTQY